MYRFKNQDVQSIDNVRHYCHAKYVEAAQARLHRQNLVFTFCSKNPQSFINGKKVSYVKQIIIKKF